MVDSAQLDLVVEDIVADVLTDELLRQFEAKALRDLLEREVFSPLLIDAQEDGSKEAMAEFWAVRISLDPLIKYLGALEVCEDEIAEDYLKTFEQVEEQINFPAGVAFHLALAEHGVPLIGGNKT